MFTLNCKRELVHKCCLWQNYRKSPHNGVIYSAYREAEFRCIPLIKKFETKKKKRIDCNNLGSFYNCINKSGSNIGTLIDSAANLVFDDTEKPDLLNSYFAQCGLTMMVLPLSYSALHL